MNDEQQQELSNIGVVRRDQMLNELKLSVIENHRRKKRRRLGTSVALLFTVIFFAVWQFTSPESIQTVVIEKVRTRQTQLPNQDAPRPDPALAQPNQFKSNLLDFKLVSGEEILDLLREVGQPSALAEIDSEWVAIPVGSIARNQ